MASKTGIYYAILIAINPYGNNGKEYGWVTNEEGEEMTMAGFTKMAKRCCHDFAKKRFRDTLNGGGDVKVFADRDKFAKEYEGLTGRKPKVS